LVREAAEFFIVQILLAPDADSYRVLGATPDASAGDLRRNVALLLRWLHPDVDPKGERSMFATRVTRAWNDLKTPDRRAAYNRNQAPRNLRTQKSPLEKKPSGAKPARKISSVSATRGSDARPATRWLSRMYIPRRIGFVQRLLIHLLGRPIL
jgi:curved DNA-binding protein CbpA